MWVEVDRDKVLTTFEVGDRIRVDCGAGVTYEGLLHSCQEDSVGGLIRLANKDWDWDYPVTLYIWPGRTFYRWEEQCCTGGPTAVVDESKLRLHNPERAKKLHAHVGELIKQQTTRCDVQVGHQTYILKPGDHLRVWWEDGAIWSELVQENE